MKNRIITVFIAVLLILSAASCSSPTETKSSNTSSVVSENDDYDISSQDNESFNHESNSLNSSDITGTETNSWKKQAKLIENSQVSDKSKTEESSTMPNETSNTSVTPKAEESSTMPNETSHTSVTPKAEESSTQQQSKPQQEDKVKVPNVVGKSKNDAVNSLKAAGLIVSTTENYSYNVASDKVISQSISSGSSVAKNTNIDITVSKGKKPITVTFDANGGTVSQSSATVYKGTFYGSLPTPTKNYHKFLGWYTSDKDGDIITSSTTVSNDYNHTIYAHWSKKPVSGWVLASKLPSGAKTVDQKWTYDLTTTTTSSNSELSGYILYDTQWYWSDYGAWSGWQNDAVSSSDTRQVDTQYINPTYKTQYNYNRWKSNSGYNWGPCKGTWSGVYCPNYEERGWSDDCLPFVATRYSGQVGGNYNTYGDDGSNAWYNEWTQQVQTGGGYTQYRYRDRYRIYTYYFRKTEAKESSTEITPGENITNVKKYVRYRER